MSEGDAAGIEQALRSLRLSWYCHDAAVRRELGLAASDTIAILLVGDGVAAPGELSRRIGLTSAGTSSLLDRLEYSGLVRRERDAADGRRVLVRLTREGLQARARMLEVDRAASELARERAAEITRFLTRAAHAVIAHASDHRTG